MSSRDTILSSLRAHPRPFQAVLPRPDAYLPVTRVSTDDLLTRFTSELEQRFGTVIVATSPEDAIQHVLTLIEPDKRVLAWENLPITGLSETFGERQIELVHLRARGADRAASLQEGESIRIGITGADAAFATTGTLALVTTKGHGRITSLLPPVHIALLDRRNLFVNMEDWFLSSGRSAVKESRSVAFVTGPSSTGDIEQHNVLGAHGPEAVYVIVF